MRGLRYNHGVRVVLAILAALGLAVVAATASRADTAPIADSPDLPWTNPTHESDLELLLSKIAAEIAKKDVTVRCEGDTDWRKLVTERGGDPNAELGYVGVDFSPRGRLRSISPFAELTGETVCLPLKRFAVAQTKPTKCTVVSYKRSTVYVQKRVDGVLKRVPKVVFTKLNRGRRPATSARCTAPARCRRPTGMRTAPTRTRSSRSPTSRSICRRTSATSTTRWARRRRTARACR